MFRAGDTLDAARVEMRGQPLVRRMSRTGYRNLIALLLALAWAVSAIAAPSAPSLISPGSSLGPGQAITDLTPRMRWNHVPGATGYGLYVSDLTTGGKLVYDNDFVPYGDDLTLPSGTLVTGHRYRWNMRARDGSGWRSFPARLDFDTETLITASRQPA